MELELMDFLWRRRPYIFHSVLILGIAAFIRISDACSSRSIPKVRSPPALAVPPALSVPASASAHHQLQTTTANYTIPHYDCPDKYQKWYCLNGATCFTVKIGETILYNCRCLVGYMGQRCEFKDTDESYEYVRHRYVVKTASVAGGVTLGVIILAVVIVAATYYARRRKARTKETTNPPSISPEQLLRSPFGRALSRTDKTFPIGRSTWSPTQPGAFLPSIRVVSEQETLLKKLNTAPPRRAPKASVSDVSLSGMDKDAGGDVLVAVDVGHPPQEGAARAPNSQFSAG
ncbi:protein spitz-like [Paramacrobiotus metropolitanus]|uniref:protein spitz-like n=1 Tax=Paramacrobiotus metropolitanus TaxID=2943436 RepID=UPI002445BC44|nr:protein spitz-like [Paramacrobiotus metropolitanus]